MAHHFGHGTLPPGDHRRTARHRLNHSQAEGLRPFDGKEQGQGVTQKRALFSLADFTHVLDQRIIQKRPDDRLVILAIHPVYFGRDLERHSDALRHRDGGIHLFLRRYATQESQVAAGLGLEGVQVEWQAMIHRADPVHPRQWLTLRIGDRYQRHLTEFLVQRAQVRNIQAAVQGCKSRPEVTPDQWKMQVVGMEVNDVELPGILEDPFQHPHIMS